MVFRATIQSQITLFLLQSSNVLKKKLTKGFFLKGSFSSESGLTNWQNNGRLPLESEDRKHISSVAGFILDSLQD